MTSIFYRSPLRATKPCRPQPRASRLASPALPYCIMGIFPDSSSSDEASPVEYTWVYCGGANGTAEAMLRGEQRACAGAAVVHDVFGEGTIEKIAG